MSGGAGDKLPVYAGSPSSSTSTSRLTLSPAPTPTSAGLSSTRYRVTKSASTDTRDPDDHRSQSSDVRSQQHHNGEEYGRAGANPYAYVQEAAWGRPRLARRHSRSTSPTAHSDDPLFSNSPFAALLNQPHFWRAPKRARIKYQLRSALRSIRLRHVGYLVLYLLPVVAIAVFVLFTFYEPQIEITLYSRRWVHDEVDPVLPLSGCFQQAEKEGPYNLTERVWQKASTWDVHAGVDMWKGMDCYDFAGIIGSRKEKTTDDLKPLPSDKRTIYHTYWRTDLAPFGPRQEYMLKSFFATQPIHKTRLIMWSNGDLTVNAIINDYMRRFPESFTVKQVDMRLLAVGTALEGSDRLESQDKRAWVDGDLVRLLVLWNLGGVWIDMDSLLTRSLEPLLEHEFVTQWDCYNKPHTPLNGALMHFHAQSPYLCEAFHIMATSTLPRSGSTDWGSLLYIRLWRRLVRAGIPPFKVLPWCFSDGRSCRVDNRLPDPFRKDGEGQGRWIPGLRSSASASSLSDADLNSPPSAWNPGGSKTLGNGGRVMGMEEGGLLDEVLHKIFSVHLHNQWEKHFPKDGWVDRLLLKRYEKTMQSIMVVPYGSSGTTQNLDKRTLEAEVEEDETTADNEAKKLT